MNVVQQLMIMIGGDTGGLEGALGTADKTLKEFGTSFTSVIEGLSFSALIAGAVEAGKTFEEASIKMQRATGATGEALAGMEEQFANLYKTNTQSADAIAGALSLISQKTNATGKDLEDLTAISLKFAKVTGSDVATSVEQNQNLFAQWGIATAQQTEKMNKMVVVSQATGISVTKLTESMLALGPALRTVGFGFDESLALIGNFSKHGVDAQGVVGALDKIMGVFAKQGITDTKTALELLNAKLQEAPDKATALKIAVEAIGGKAGALVGYVDAVRLAVFHTDALMKKQAEASDTVSQLAADTQTLGGMLTKLQHQLTDALEPLGKGLITAATDAATALTPLIQTVGNVVKAFGELPGYVEGAIASLAFFGANPITLGILGLAAAAGILASEFKGLTAVSHSLDGAFAKFLSDQVTGAKSAKDFAKAEELINKSLDAGAISAADAAKALTLLTAAQDKSTFTGFDTGVTVLKPKGSATPPPATETLPVGSFKPIKELNDALEILVMQEHTAQAAHKATLQVIADEGLGVELHNLLQLANAFVGMNSVMNEDVSKAPEVTSHFAAMAKEFDAGTKTIGLFTAGITASQQAALDTSPYGKLEAAFGTLHLSINSLTGDLENKLVAAFGVVAKSDLTTASQVEESWGAASNAINKLAKSDLPGAVSAYQTYIDALKRTDAAIGDIYAAQEKMLTLEIQIKQNRGVSSAAEIVQLTNVQMRQQALNTLSAGLGPIYKGLAQNFDQAFSTIGNNIVAGITQAKTWGQAWRDTLKSIETSILTTVIGSFTKMAAAWVTALLTKKVADSAATIATLAGIAKITAAQTAGAAAQVAAIGTVTAAMTASIATIAGAQTAASVAAKTESSLLDVAEVTGQAAIGGASVAAWTAAIPVIGPGLAIEAGLAETAAIEAAFGPLAAFDQGGRVPYDMMAMVHKGEYFLPAHETAMAAAGGGGVVLNFYGNFTGVTQDLVNTVMNRAIANARRAGAKI